MFSSQCRRSRWCAFCSRKSRARFCGISSRLTGRSGIVWGSCLKCRGRSEQSRWQWRQHDKRQSCDRGYLFQTSSWGPGYSWRDQHSVFCGSHSLPARGRSSCRGGGGAACAPTPPSCCSTFADATTTQLSISKAFRVSGPTPFCLARSWCSICASARSHTLYATQKEHCEKAWHGFCPHRPPSGHLCTWHSLHSRSCCHQYAAFYATALFLCHQRLRYLWCAVYTASHCLQPSISALFFRTLGRAHARTQG
mmetsp:Transcript_15609/g.22835  ORF Transcript_15609/g.22835 Transcript_15609/m.22835 type:complete len:252 (+) Transcript_15609:413-1168(+)